MVLMLVSGMIKVLNPHVISLTYLVYIRVPSRDPFIPALQSGAFSFAPGGVSWGLKNPALSCGIFVTI
jgi:hypothetical protein